MVSNPVARKFNLRAFTLPEFTVIRPPVPVLLMVIFLTLMLEVITG